MGERIYSKNGDKLELMKEERFKSESKLQELIANHLELLDGEQIRPGNPRRWILVKREQGIPAEPGGSDWWSLDLLCIDQDAVPTLVEVKRGSNSEVRRTVVGQMLEYAAHAPRSWQADELRRTFEAQDGHAERLRELLQEDEPNADAFWGSVATNLEASRLRLLFVADEIPDSLAHIVEFLNEQMPIEVLAVELKQFKGKASQTLVPRVIGRTSNRAMASSQQNITRRNVLELFKQHAAPRAYEAAKRLIAVADKHNADFGPGSRGISIRGRRASGSLVSVAWLYYQPDVYGIGRTMDFSFGALAKDMDSSDQVNKVLSRWVDYFRECGFAEDVSTPTVPAHKVRHDDAASHIDLLAGRLDKVLADLRAL